MIQGTGTHGDAWNPQVERLQSEYQCLTFDNRGMADSQPLGVKQPAALLKWPMTP
ncbi:MAG: hypothetical protein U0930_05500 [Pirellulales bacterium]